ncbi:M24 family metallopeptidase [Desulfurella sp.]|uniref:M24 family metallopeptidase n=1 Tax=Desulfurella sp. TaxID=1962857 RepID=UPI003D0A23BC
MTRVEKINKKVNEIDADCFVSFDKSDMLYFTQIYEDGILLIIEHTTYIFANKLSYDSIVNQKPQASVILANQGIKSLQELLIENKIHSIALDLKNTTAFQYETLKKNFEIKDATDFSKQIRMIKEQSEINAIKRAAIVARNAFTKVYPMIKIGVSEKEIKDELDYQMTKFGAQKSAFETIVASGINTSYPHHSPTDKKIEDGDFLMIDFGACVDGYNSDCTYTFLIGNRTDEERNFYNELFYTQTFTREFIAPNRTHAKDIDKRARDELAKYGLDKYFIHLTGHGVGLDIHELPYIDSSSETLIVPNMVFTIEPGIYIPGKYGVRIEQTILIKENDVEILGYAPFMEII